MSRPALHLLTVSEAKHITPNMTRTTLIGAPITRICDGCEGANCKIYLPEPDQSRTAFVRQLTDGPRPVVQALPKDGTYISGYWKLGLIEDEHQKMKRAEEIAA